MNLHRHSTATGPVNSIFYFLRDFSNHLKTDPKNTESKQVSSGPVRAGTETMNCTMFLIKHMKRAFYSNRAFAQYVYW